MGSSQTTTQNNKPYEAAQPMIDQGLRDAQSMYNSGGFNIQPYQGDLVAGYDPFRSQADAAAPGVVGGALGGVQAAQGAIGQQMDQNWYNPALQGVAQNVIADVMPAINSTFAMNGRTGGGLHEQNLAKGLAAGLANPYYNAFNQAQNRSLTAAGMVPGMNNAAYGALDYLSGRGEDRQAYEQQQIAADVMQDQQAQTAELQALQDYMALATGAGSMFGVQSSTTRNNPGLLGIMGLGLQGAGIGSLAGWF
jgi:hypothetical protein